MLPKMIIKAMLKKQMKGVPEADQERLLGILEKNPDFFMDMAKKVQEKVKGGMDQQQAAMEVMRESEGELKEVLGK